MAETRTGSATQKAFPQRGEIYLTALDAAVGHEIKRTRPAVVIQNDVSKRYAMTTIVAAITSRVSVPPYPSEVVIQPGGSGLEVESTIRLDQVRTVDRRRHVKRFGKVDATALRRVDDAIKVSMGLVRL